MLTFEAPRPDSPATDVQKLMCFKGCKITCEDVCSGLHAQGASVLTFQPLPVPLPAAPGQPWCDRDVHDPTTLRDIRTMV